jgi:hypothetical protein
MGPHPWDQLSYAIEAIIAAAVYPLTALLVVALVLVAIDAARERRAKRRTARTPAEVPDGAKREFRLVQGGAARADEDLRAAS